MNQLPKAVFATSRRTLCTTTDKPLPVRGDQARGAMKSFFYDTNSKEYNAAAATPPGSVPVPTGTGLWAKLRKEIRAEPANIPQHLRTGDNNQTSSSSTAPQGAFFRGPRTVGLNKRVGAPRVGGGKKFGDRPPRARGEEDRFDSKSESIPPAMRAVLFEFENNNMAGKTINTYGMDDIDRFLAEMYVSTQKTANHECRSVLEAPAHRRIQLPAPRSMAHIAMSLQPQITSAPVDSEAFALAAQSWEVISKNIYFSDKDRSYLAEGIARAVEKVTNTSTTSSSILLQDLVFQPDFRKGYAGLEEERARKAMMEQVVVENFAQGETDWDVEAVVDEDQL